MVELAAVGQTPGILPPALKRIGTMGERPIPNNAKPSKEIKGAEGVVTTITAPKLLRRPPTVAIS